MTVSVATDTFWILINVNVRARFRSYVRCSSYCNTVFTEIIILLVIISAFSARRYEKIMFVHELFIDCEWSKSAHELFIDCERSKSNYWMRVKHSRLRVKQFRLRVKQFSQSANFNASDALRWRQFCGGKIYHLAMVHSLMCANVRSWHEIPSFLNYTI